MTDNSVRPHISGAPGLVWRPRKNRWEARWQARTDLVRLGYTPKSVGIWVGACLTPEDRESIVSQCRVLQSVMLAFAEQHRTPYRKETKALAWLEAHKTYEREDCLIFPFCKHNRYGYGHLGANGKHYQAHRLMCEWTHGPAPDGKPYAAHECGNGHLGCVNPLHIFWKSPSENVLDKHKHGTMRGNTHGPRTLLNTEQIADIQGRRLSQWGFAELYGISHGAVKYWQAKAQRIAA